MSDNEIIDDGVTPPPATPWTQQDKEQIALLLAELDAMLVHPDGRMSKTGALMLESLSEACNPLLNPEQDRRTFWYPYRNGEKPMSDFFAMWLYYAPVPTGIGPGYYIEQWDYLANTKAGLMLNNEDQRFKNWFVDFLNLRGAWLNSTDSTGSIDEWMNYQGTTEHPFDISEYIVPTDGFQSFNQFFLRELKPGKRPMCPCADDPNVVIAPCDGGVFYLTRGQLEGNKYPLPGKSHDVLQLEQALPGYGGSFIGGPLLDILLWFTDYHHFRAPVSGTVIHQGMYEGSYNYDFDNYDPNDPYAPALPEDSDRVGWYRSLGKHKRYVWIFRTEELGLVAMMAIGFWGVGSIINEVPEGARLKKGDRMGHFGYGGSSIVLAFEPNLNLQFGVPDAKGGTTLVSDPDSPTLMQIQQCLGRRMPTLKWSD
ncbi:MAG: phosphatidylserine decarboxylase [Candidatus Electrothrix communis]|nr:MAG: phosphatidylserine decarboxylase [Candidatus Electrothrix communis]